jgi:hypothetical protein
MQGNLVNQNVALVVPEHHWKLAGDGPAKKHGGQHRRGG